MLTKRFQLVWIGQHKYKAKCVRCYGNLYFLHSAFKYSSKILSISHCPTKMTSIVIIDKRASIYFLTHLKLCIAIASHIFNWGGGGVNTHICTIGIKTFVNPANLTRKVIEFSFSTLEVVVRGSGICQSYQFIAHFSFPLFKISCLNWT